MATNKYFNFHDKTSEQNLLDDLVIEWIQIYGIDVVYLPRLQENLNFVYGEDVLSKFDDIYDIEMYLKTYDNFEGDGELFTKFNIDIKDRATFSVSRTRFTETVEGQLEPPRPREGDLIYLEFGEQPFLFEIRYVQENELFFPFGTLYTYELQTELYPWSHEEFETGIERIDDLEKKFDFSIDLIFTSGANNYVEDEIIYQGSSLATATATAVVNYSKDDQTLLIRDLKNEFIIGQNVVGNTSGEIQTLISVNDQDIQTENVYDQNFDIETKADIIIDFDESNPFSGDDF